MKLLTKKTEPVKIEIKEMEYYTIELSRDELVVLTEVLGKSSIAERKLILNSEQTTLGTPLYNELSEILGD